MSEQLKPYAAMQKRVHDAPRASVVDIGGNDGCHEHFPGETHVPHRDGRPRILSGIRPSLDGGDAPFTRMASFQLRERRK